MGLAAACICTGHGGGVYAQGSTINLDDEAELYNNDAGTDGSGSGGGAYLDHSSLYADKAAILSNTAASYGGGVYATNSSTVDMDLGTYTCLGVRCSQLYANMASAFDGGGIYAAGNSTVSLDNTFVEGNVARLGGGLYAYQSQVYLYSALFARNNATSTAGVSDAVRLFTGSTLSGAGNTFAYNQALGDSTGQAIGVYDASLSLSCSIIWGHASSIDSPSQDVTYSDVQGGYAGTANVNVDPLFVSPASSDYHLQSTSPVIDRCLSGPSVDFESERRPIVRSSGASPYDMGADEVAGVARVGLNGTCTYATIQQALNAAVDGDTVRVAEGTYFENVDVLKSVTVEGGYDSTCATPGSDPSRIEGSAGSGSTIDVSGGTVILRNLEVTWGSGIGAGLDVFDGVQVTLDSVDVFHNHGTYGGGIYVSPNSVVTVSNDSDVRDNSATLYGGGVRVWGRFYGDDTYSDIYDNCAPHGGGFSVQGGVLHLDAPDTYRNLAAEATGQGGGIHVAAGGTVTLTNGARVYSGNEAYDGAGIYADNATIYLVGSATTLTDNSAAHDGGAVYLTNNSALHSTGAQVGRSVAGSVNEAQRGAGIYADGSTVSFTGAIINNLASGAGAGIYATASTLYLTDATVGGTGSDQANALGPSGHTGVGLFLGDGSRATLEDTVVAGNAFQTNGYTYGGGAYVTAGSVLTLTRSRVEYHTAPSTTDGRGAGLYVNNGSVTLDDSDVVSNTAGTNGGGFRLFGSSTLRVHSGSSIRYNESLNGGGGAIAATGTPEIDISDGVLQHNSAGTDGGAIDLDAGTLDLSGWWDLRHNDARGNGGALAVTGTADADLSANGGDSFLAVNVALGHGGALYVSNSDTVEMYATNGYRIHLNTNNAGGNGGAVYAAGGAFIDVYGRLQATSNIANGLGGAFHLSGGSRIWLDDYMNDVPQVWVNRAQMGGAIYAVDSPRVECDGAEFGGSSNGNRAIAGSGGAIYLGNSTFSAENCTFQNNQATLHGGAIAAYGSGLTIGATILSPASLSAQREAERDTEREALASVVPMATGCNPLSGPCSSLHDNTAATGYGGAIYLEDSELQADQTVFDHNSAARGGAIYQGGAGSASEVQNSLLYANTSTEALGAGIRASAGSLAVTHVTLADNVGGPGFSSSSLSSSASNSIAWGNTHGGFAGSFAASTCNIDQSGIVGTNIDPQFVSPGTNYRLQQGSPAIDACTGGLPTDLDGMARPFGAGYDMGAYEYAIRLVFLPVVLRDY
jgi:predicted outer membrane repeat protein